MKQLDKLRSGSVIYHIGIRLDNAGVKVFKNVSKTFLFDSTEARIAFNDPVQDQCLKVLLVELANNTAVNLLITGIAGINSIVLYNAVKIGLF